MDVCAQALRDSNNLFSALIKYEPTVKNVIWGKSPTWKQRTPQNKHEERTMTAMQGTEENFKETCHNVLWEIRYYMQEKRMGYKQKKEFSE